MFDTINAFHTGAVYNTADVVFIVGILTVKFKNMILSVHYKA